MAIGQQVSIASKNYCYICVIFSNNDIAITIFVCMIYMEPDTGISFKMVTIQITHLFKLKHIVLINIFTFIINCTVKHFVQSLSNY